MVKIKNDNLTPLGRIIADKGLAISYVVEKSGVNRNRLLALRSVDSAILSFEEARALAPVLGYSTDELGKVIDALKVQNQENAPA